MSQQCSWPTHSWPLEGRCPYYALLGLTQAPGFAGGSDFVFTCATKNKSRLEVEVMNKLVIHIRGQDHGNDFRSVFDRRECSGKNAAALFPAVDITDDADHLLLNQTVQQHID